MESIRSTVLRTVAQAQIIAILRGLQPGQCPAVAQGLLNGGIRMIEITFDQRHPETHSATASAIEAIRTQLDGQVLVGAGTVTTPELVRLAFEAGAGYIISPDVNTRVIATTRELGMVSMPGAMTPTEILTAHEAGADFVKLFPAAMLGIPYLKAIRGPISHVKLLAVGGIHAGNARAFLDAGVCGLGVGGNLARPEWAAQGRYEAYTEAARELVAALQSPAL